LSAADGRPRASVLLVPYVSGGGVDVLAYAYATATAADRSRRPPGGGGAGVPAVPFRPFHPQLLVDRNSSAPVQSSPISIDPRRRPSRARHGWAHVPWPLLFLLGTVHMSPDLSP
jgi:hypothetical protein